MIKNILARTPLFPSNGPTISSKFDECLPFPAHERVRSIVGFEPRDVAEDQR